MIALVTACLTAVSASAVAPPPRCNLTYDALHRAIVLEHHGADVSIDTRIEPDGLHVLVDFARPAEVCLGASLQAAEAFAHWRQDGNRLSIVFDAPYELTVVDDPVKEESRLINVALVMPPVAVAAAHPPAPLPAPVPLPMPPVLPSAAAEPEAVPMVVAARLPVPPALPVVPPTLPPLPAAPVVAPGPDDVAAPPPPAEAPPVQLGGPVAAPAGGLTALAVVPRVGVGGYTETYLPGDVAVQSGGIAMPGVRLEGRGLVPWGPTWLQGAWDGAIQLDFASIAFRDTLLPLSTHTRQTWRAELTATKRFTAGDWRLDAGLGYGMRSESTLHSAVAPAPSYAFSAGRLLHGPLLALGGAWAPARATGNPWLDGWSARLDAGVQPVVFSQLDAGVPALPWLVGTQVALSVERRVAAWTVSVGFQRRGLDGAAYGEVFQGPFLTVR